MVKWDEPEHPNGLIVSYQIEYRKADLDRVCYYFFICSFFDFIKY